MADDVSGEHTGTNGTKLSNYTIDVPIAPYLNTTYDYNIVAAIPYIAGVSVFFPSILFSADRYLGIWYHRYPILQLFHRPH